jgi:hypothetical protein
MPIGNIGEITAFFSSPSGMKPSMSDNWCYVNRGKSPNQGGFAPAAPKSILLAVNWLILLF